MTYSTQKIFFKSFFGTLFFLILSSPIFASSQPSQTYPLFKTDNKLLIPPLLGHGQDLISLTPLDYVCMEGEEKTVPLNYIQGKMELVKDFNQLIQERNYKVEGSFLFSLLKGNAEAKYLNRYQKDLLSTKFRYVQDIQLQQKILVGGRLKEQMGEGFIRKCGQQYISVSTQGA